MVPMLLSPLGADTVKTESGHLLSGEITEENETELRFTARRIVVHKKAIRGFGFENAAGEGREFFAKLELKDGSKIVGWVERKPDGDVIVKKHTVFGENHAVTKGEIRRLTAIGKMRALTDIGSVSGFVTAENPETMTLELEDAPLIAIRHSDIKMRDPRRPKKKPDRNDLPAQMIGINALYSMPQGRLADFVGFSVGGGADYYRTMPDRVHWLGYLTLSGRAQYFAGQNLKIYLGQLYAGIAKTFTFASGHALFARLAGGVNLQHMRDREFSATGAVAGGVAGGGYIFTRGKTSLMMTGFYQYFYDKVYPLIGFGAELGFFYAL